MSGTKRTTFSVAAFGSGQASSTVKRPNAGLRRNSAAPDVVAVAASPARSLIPKPQGERVKVFVRVRPTCGASETPGALHLSADGIALTVTKRDDYGSADFVFDRVLAQDASQADCYDAAVRPVVADVLRGYNATLLAYGQTGAGKTFTLGSIRPDAVGMIPRAAAEIFAAVAADRGHAHTVHLSYLQIYCEQIQDLLCPEAGDNLPIREGEGGVCVPGLRQVEVRSLDDCLRLLQLGDRNRTVAFTALNAHSSRSHAVVMLTVVKRRNIAGDGGGAAAQRVHVGKLFMVDLAGSERLKKSRSTGQRASEAKSINLSLTMLGMCVNARADPTATHVPFRDSKLTRLLQESLGGNAKTSLLVAVSDAAEHCEETAQSLSFGLRAMRVVNQARVNERVDVGGEAAAGTQTAALLAALHGADDRSTALERSLLEREGALEEAEARLKAEREKSAQVVRALEAERQGAQAQARELIEQHASRLQREERQRATLQERLAAAEACTTKLRRQHDCERGELMAAVEELGRAAGDAKRAAAAAAEQHATQLESERRHWRAEIDAQQGAHTAESSAVAARHAKEMDAARHEARSAVAQLAAAQAASAAAAAAHAQTLDSVNAEWAGRLQQAEESARQAGEEAARNAAEVADLQQQLRRSERRLAKSAAQCQAAAEEHAAAAVAANESWQVRWERAAGAARQQEREAAAQAAARDAEVVELRGALKHSEVKLAQAKGAAAQLETALTQMRVAVTALQERTAAAERGAAGAEERVQRAEAHVAEERAASVAMAAAFFKRRRVNDAAKIIQRAYRQHHLRQMSKQRREGYAALHEAQHALGSLAEQHAELERRRHGNLAFTGQTLVAESLGVLQGAVEAMVATFLLPAKDLKTLQKYRRAGGARGAAPQGAEGVLLAPCELPAQRQQQAFSIRAFNPAAAAAYSSAPLSRGVAGTKLAGWD